ncbi:MAG: hypothetical protein IAB08_05580 [Bacteroidetes bacterium]|uniref:Uncharacterized protein n=1 Tax=Candidatus Pullibacteroides excrementavium TaxID=2840905 RepID=A0A9D9DV82_9BACT|nr:hypothetical protein [Candidatus Pullibacteroides excrementavium]
MDYKFHRINTVPAKSEPGCVYFENSTKKIKLGEDDGSYVEFGGGSSVQPSPNDVIIDISLVQETEGSVEEEPELVTLLQKYATAANSGASVMPKLFVKETKEVRGATVSFMYPASFNGNVLEVEGKTIIYPGLLSYTKMNPESGIFNVATTFATIVYAANTFAIMGIKTIAMSGSGSASKVLAENGTWVSLPSITVDSEMSDTSSNPVQNKIVKAALDGKGDIIVIDQNEYLNGPISSAHLNALKSGGKMLYVRIPAGEVGGSMYMSFMPCAYIYNTTALYISRLEPITAGTRLFMKLYDKDTGVLKETYAVVLKSDGDGTKFLNDQGEYSAPPTQERGTVVFFSSGISSSVSGKGLAVKKSSLKPTGITPVVGKDIVIQVTSGIIGLITSSDLQNYYLSYDNGALLQGIINS